MIEKAEVLYKKGHKAIVRLEQQKTCNHCSSRSICQLTTGQIEAENKIGAEQGDLVEVEISAPEIVRKTFLFYFLSAVFFLTSTVFAFLIGASELLSVGIGFLCLIGVFLILTMILRSNFRKEELKPRIVRVI